jgi:hypothetical protein
MSTTCTETIYIQSASSLKESYERIQAIILALQLAVVDLAPKAGLTDYSLDDGQVKIKTSYRNADDIAKAILSYEKIAQGILNQLNGRVMTVRNGRGLV